MKVVTFHQGNLKDGLLQAQKSVFEHFGLEINQIESVFSHAKSIDLYLSGSDFDTIAIFDADCIPLTKDLLSFAERKAKEGFIIGNRQRSSHIKESVDFVAPSFICFSKETYLKVSTSFEPIKGKGDVAEAFSRQAEKVGIELFMFDVLKVHKPIWKLSNGQMFGYGTTYSHDRQPLTYHAFESNAKHHSSDNFIKKCNEILLHKP